MAQAPLRLKPHLSASQLKRRYKTCRDPRQKTYWQLLWLMSNRRRPVTVSQAAALVGLHVNWARQLVHRYNQHGPDKYYDRRRHNQGQAPVLTRRQQTALHAAVLTKEPPGGGLWSSVSVADWIHEKTGKRPSAVTGWQYLKKLGFTLQVPRPQHIHAASLPERAAFKKSSTKRFAGSNVVFQTEW